MDETDESGRGTRGAVARRALWGIGAAVCAFYGAYALAMGAAGALSLLGLADGVPHRAAPLAFAVHAFAGGLALLSGPLQLNRWLLRRWRGFHRATGRVYVGAVWLASVTGLWMAAVLDASAAAKAGFGALAVLWFATTTIALVHILRRRVAAHRAWMLRSFALSLFFVTFSAWAPGAASSSGREDVGYALGVWLSWLLNLLVAEVWIRRFGQRPLPRPRDSLVGEQAGGSLAGRRAKAPRAVALVSPPPAARLAGAQGAPRRRRPTSANTSIPAPGPGMTAAVTR